MACVMHATNSTAKAPRCIVCVGKFAAASARSKPFIDIWANLVADGLFDPIGGHISGFNHVVACARFSDI